MSDRLGSSRMSFIVSPSLSSKLAVGGGPISQLPGGSSVKTDAKKFESTAALSSSVSVSIPFGFFEARIDSLMVVFWRT